MKFPIANQLPVALRNSLADKGHDAMHVLDLGMSRASDFEVGQWASQEGRAIITKDEDFSVLVAIGRCSASVIWVRLGNCRSETLLEIFSRSLDSILEQLHSGEMMIQLIR